jgi:hypothetical protein
MFISRIVLATLLAALGSTQIARAADTSAFDVLLNDHDGKPTMFQSTSALKKGDVIEIHAFNARPVMILQVAMCNTDCPRMHIVKTVHLYPYYAGTSNVNQRFAVPENGHVSFWVQQFDSAFATPIIVGGGTWDYVYVNRYLSFETPMLYLDTQPMPVSALRLDENKLRARYFHNTFITVSLADSNS